LFRKQLSLARDLGLPVIVHDRDAHEDTMKAIKEFPGVKGIVHCFSGSVEMAKILIKMGFYISFGGPVTFKNAVRSGEVVKYVPLDRLLIETDCPYLTPFPYRGQRNDSGYLGIIAEKISELKGITYEEVAEATFKNAATLFNILN
ncbi:MAG TPA: TatD family hydrolase, partial [Clostridia bacterium]